MIWWLIGVAIVGVLYMVVWLARRPFLPSNEEIARDLSGKIGERAAEEWLRRRRL